MALEDLFRLVGVAHALIDAAPANRDVQHHLADPRSARFWTREGVRKNPTCRLEWEHTVVIGCIGESLAAARRKNWGVFIGIHPLRLDDPVHWCRVLYIYKSSSPYRRGHDQRHALKRILGRQHRPLVTQAARSTKRSFLASLSETGAFVVKSRLHLEPGQFWRAAKGFDLLDLPNPMAQLLLFEDP